MRHVLQEVMSKKSFDDLMTLLDPVYEGVIPKKFSYIPSES